MSGKVLELEDILVPDDIAYRISEQWVSWKNLRVNREAAWKEIREYIYATDTTQTSNNSLPWKNKTTIPKLCQIRDNLYANYMASMFPKRNWLEWEGASEDEESYDKREAIESFMSWAVERSEFKSVISKLVLDYIDYGNCFVMPIWRDDRNLIEDENREQVGYVGPAIQRISPMDIVFNPLAPTFAQSPKIIRSFVSIGEAKRIIESQTAEDDEEAAQEIFNRLMEVRSHVANFQGEISIRDSFFEMDGFTSYRDYLGSQYVEVLYFYGDYYDRIEEKLYKNHVITIMDRYRVISKKPNPSFFGQAPIWTAGWRPRQDNLWAMGPLENLVGMQYRIDHLENLKADVFDVIAFPPLKIKGYVDDFEWGPMERIYVGDDGDVNMLVPDVQALQADFQIQTLENKMEEMAGAPKQAMGFRTPGEKTAYEVQRLENSASRIFQNKIMQFEEELVEPALNGMLELAKRKMDGATTIRVVGDEDSFVTFNTLSAADITGQGRIRPVAARHFAERAELVQNLTNFYNSAMGQDPEVRRHFNSFKLAKMFEDLLGAEQYDLVEKDVRILEEQEAQSLAQSSQEQTMMEGQTPSGLTPEDSDQGF